MQPEDLIGAFPDLDEMTEECPRGCTHGTDEPECGLDEAVAAGRRTRSGSRRSGACSAPAANRRTDRPSLPHGPGAGVAGQHREREHGQRGQPEQHVQHHAHGAGAACSQAASTARTPNPSVTQNSRIARVRWVWRISSCWSSGGLLLKKFMPVK